MFHIPPLSIALFQIVVQLLIKSVLDFRAMFPNKTQAEG